MYICTIINHKKNKMNNEIKKTEELIDVIKTKISESLDREEISMLSRAMQEAFTLLTTLRYINQ